MILIDWFFDFSIHWFFDSSILWWFDCLVAPLHLWVSALAVFVACCCSFLLSSPRVFVRVSLMLVAFGHKQRGTSDKSNIDMWDVSILLQRIYTVWESSRSLRHNEYRSVELSSILKVPTQTLLNRNFNYLCPPLQLGTAFRGPPAHTRVFCNHSWHCIGFCIWKRSICVAMLIAHGSAVVVVHWWPGYTVASLSFRFGRLRRLLLQFSVVSPARLRAHISNAGRFWS